MITTWLLRTTIAATLLLVACDNTQPVEERWTADGLEVRSVADGPTLAEGTCRSSTVEGVAATVCAYPNEQAAKDARKAGLEHIGDKTGAALVKGTELLVVVDRDQSDPNGRTIHRMTKAFAATPEPAPAVTTPLGFGAPAADPAAKEATN